nr:MAG TPA: hypothetical protein [Caudoviricetes sp.]
MICLLFDDRSLRQGSRPNFSRIDTRTLVSD